jgi:hypothetical protein
VDVGQPCTGLAVLDVRIGIVGHQRVDAQDQARTVPQRDRGVQGLLQHAVDVVATLDAHRRKQSW